MRTRSQVTAAAVAEKPAEPERRVVPKDADQSQRKPDALLAEAAKHVDLRPGERLTVRLGAELFSPVKYNTFEVGGFAAEVIVREDETGEDAFLRAYRLLARLDEAEFALAWDRFKGRLRETTKERR